MNRSIRIQDKVGGRRFGIRQVRRRPYNTGSFDILQITSLMNKTVYAISMRYFSNGIHSYFSEQDLMTQHINFTQVCKAEHASLSMITMIK